jgi:hypothetical protein
MDTNSDTSHMAHKWAWRICIFALIGRFQLVRCVAGVALVKQVNEVLRLEHTFALQRYANSTAARFMSAKSAKKSPAI